MPANGSELTERFRVGDWTADANSLTVSRDGKMRTLEPRAFGVLRYFAERPGKLVTIDDLMDALWPDVVVTPNAVTRVIAQLRKALGDEAKKPKYLQTVARSGYRLVADVGPADARASTRRWNKLLLPAATVVVLAIVATVVLDFELPRDDGGHAVAVLPFENYTGDTKMDYLGAGVAEEVTNALAQVPELNVMARTLSFRFTESDSEPRDFARSLGVDYFVEGSVRQSGRQLRITAQLIAVDSGYHLWSHTAENEFYDVFDAQDAISRGVAGALAGELGLAAPPDPVAARYEPDPEAYNLYLRGRYIWHRRGSEPLQPAVDAFLEAVKIDPDFARGWAALASAYLTWPTYSPKGHATWQLAEDAALKARALDPDIPEIYGVLGTFAETRYQWIEAHALFSEGVRRDPKSATAHYWYSEHLAKLGRHRDSLGHMRRSRELDPTYVAPRIDLAFTTMILGDTASGAAMFRELWDEGVRNITIWSGNFIASVLIRDFDRGRSLIAESPASDSQQALLREFVAVEAREADPGPLVARLFPADGPAFDHRLLTWVGARLEAWPEVIGMIGDRYERGLFIDPRPMWGPGTRLYAAPGFPALAEKLGLIDYWETVAWGDACRPGSDGVVCDGAGYLSVVAETE